MKEIISTDDSPKAIGPYSQGVRLNGIMFISGQIPKDPKTDQLIEGTIQVQTERVLDNLKAVVEAAGLSLADVVKTTIFLKDIGTFKQMNEVYARYFPDNPPARSTVEVAKLPLGVSIEIDAIAMEGSLRR